MKVSKRVLAEAGIGISGLSATSMSAFAKPARFKKATPGSKEHTYATVPSGKGPDKQRKQPAQAGTAKIQIAGGGGKKKKAKS